MSKPANANMTRAPLLSIAAARASVISQTQPVVGDDHVPLLLARGRILRGELVSPRALPVFDQSAMDGYALCLADGAASYALVGRVAAGAMAREALQPGQAMRIFTGAPVPRGADCIAMQENVSLESGQVTLSRPARAGDNIRHAGEDVAAGELLARGGAVLDARHIGLAAAVGLGALCVRRQLRVALASTGNELVDAGGALGDGAVFDSNRPMLLAALERPALAIRDFGVLRDDRAAIAAFFADASKSFDLIVTTGGASVGDEDHLAGALRDAGGAIAAAHVAIRPGKPFTHGRIGAASVAILPGNPFAALVAALLFVRPMIERALGLEASPFAPLPALAGFAHSRPQERTEFLPARILSREASGLVVVERLGRGGSARLKPLIDADGLAVVAPGMQPVAHGDPIGYLPFGAAFQL